MLCTKSTEAHQTKQSPEDYAGEESGGLQLTFLKKTEMDTVK